MLRRIARIVGWGLAVVALLIVLAGAGFYAWATIIPAPMPEALAALVSDEQVTVTDGDWLTFSPTGNAPTVGLIMYPGGRVDYRAYSPAYRELAAAGYLVIGLRSPLNLAITDIGAADAVIAAHPEITSWAVGGHSLGGATAAFYIAVHSDVVTGLVLWASFPAGDISGLPLQVVSVSGSLDGLAVPDDIAASRPLLPANTTFVAIEGGNHAQFGYYGDQAGDNTASISRDEQQAQTVAATQALLDQLSGAS